MRNGYVPAFLLVLGAVVLGATVFPEQIVHAAKEPFQNVVVVNPSTQPVPVQVAGTSSVSGTVKVDPAGNTVALGPTDRSLLADTATRLASIDATTGKRVVGVCSTGETVPLGGNNVICSTTGSWDVSTIIATGMDAVALHFYLDEQRQFFINGSGIAGTSAYQLNLPRPVRIDKIEGFCAELGRCRLVLNVLGTVNP